MIFEHLQHPKDTTEEYNNSALTRKLNELAISIREIQDIMLEADKNG